MSRVAPPSGEEVEIDKRHAMTPARMKRIWTREGGICWWCGVAVPERGPNVRYDHKVPLELKGSDDDSEIFPIHRNPCDIEKLKTEDRPAIDKTRRLRKTRLGTARVKPKIPGRGFDQTRTRKMNGTVVPRRKR
jgi:hypothetical protein